MSILVETHAGEPIEVGDSKIVPLAKAVRFQKTGWLGGVIWNRPVAVVVQTGDDEERVIPIRDVTRIAQLAIFGSGLFFIWIVWLITRRK